jgi:hypothetical protein
MWVVEEGNPRGATGPDRLPAIVYKDHLFNLLDAVLCTLRYHYATGHPASTCEDLCLKIHPHPPKPTA